MEAIRTIPDGSAVKFIKGLVSRFGVPNRIITNNGSQFTSNLFKTYCANLGTQICYASVAHPRSNDQAERANAEVLRGLKTRTFKKKLEACGRAWYDELQSVLWSIRTTTTKPTGETPFFLVYGDEAVSLTRSDVAPHGSWRSTRRSRTPCEGRISCWGRNTVGKPHYERQGINRRYNDTIAATSAPGPLR